MVPVIAPGQTEKHTWTPEEFAGAKRTWSPEEFAAPAKKTWTPQEFAAPAPTPQVQDAGFQATGGFRQSGANLQQGREYTNPITAGEKWERMDLVEKLPFVGGLASSYKDLQRRDDVALLKQEKKQQYHIQVR